MPESRRASRRTGARKESAINVRRRSVARKSRCSRVCGLPSTRQTSFQAISSASARRRRGSRSAQARRCAGGHAESQIARMEHGPRHRRDRDRTFPSGRTTRASSVTPDAGSRRAQASRSRGRRRRRRRRRGAVARPRLRPRCRSHGYCVAPRRRCSSLFRSAEPLQDQSVGVADVEHADVRKALADPLPEQWSRQAWKYRRTRRWCPSGPGRPRRSGAPPGCRSSRRRQPEAPGARRAGPDELAEHPTRSRCPAVTVRSARRATRP